MLLKALYVEFLIIIVGTTKLDGTIRAFFCYRLNDDVKKFIETALGETLK